MPRSNVRWLAVAVVLAACLPYLPTIDDYFTQDDFGGMQLLASKPWATFPRWFTMPWMEYIWGYTPDEIRPFVAFTYQVTALPGADRPELHHLFNILMHAANAVLVMGLARAAIGLSPLSAALAGIMFAILPLQAESVAWITGRVDSMPAFFYMATVYAYVRWAQGGGRRWYTAALALFFVALFSKQNTITMTATLAAYDVIVRTKATFGALHWRVLAWLPFIAMTLGYLGLRRMLFGAAVRGGIESRDQLAAASDIMERHLLRTVFGHAGPAAAWEWLALFAVLGGIGFLVARRRDYIRHVLCFGVAWWIIGVVPVLVAGYESPRHVYLAAAGWAFLLGMFFEAGRYLASERRGPSRTAVLAAALAVGSAYVVRLHREVTTWGAWAQVSRLAVERVGQEAASAPEGTLLLVSVPQKSWEWATPFVLRPPYSPADFASKVNLVTPFRLYCCGPTQWESYTRMRLDDWSRTQAPIVALYFEPETGAVSRMTDADNRELRTIVTILGETDSWQTLNGAIVRLMEQVVRRR